MFKRLPDAAANAVVMVTIDGVPVHMRAGDSVAAALLVAGRPACASRDAGGLRGPYCIVGVCCECRVSIDGIADQLACRVTVTSGMRVETHIGAKMR